MSRPTHLLLVIGSLCALPSCADKIQKYYDDAGTSGWFTLHWAPL